MPDKVEVIVELSKEQREVLDPYLEKLAEALANADSYLDRRVIIIPTNQTKLLCELLAAADQVLFRLR